MEPLPVPVPPPGPWSSPAPRRRRPPWLNLALLVATFATLLLSGALGASLPASPRPADYLLAGLPYAVALLGILAAHELGHYLMARAWGVDSTLPFFIPGIPPVGTFGAVIRIRAVIPGRRALLDIGAAGPLAGALVAIPLYAWGLAHSEVRPLGDAFLEKGNAGSLLALAQAVLAGQPVHGAGHGLTVMGDSLLTWWLQRLVHGTLPPFHDVFLHPVGQAAWFGLLVTTLNLMPLGQLDGGHVVYALLGERRALLFSRLVSWGLLGAGLVFSWNWLVWWAVTRFVVRLRHPPPRADEPLDPGRAAVAVISLLLFAATFIPVPVSV